MKVSSKYPPLTNQDYRIKRKLTNDVHVESDAAIILADVFKLQDTPKTTPLKICTMFNET